MERIKIHTSGTGILFQTEWIMGKPVSCSLLKYYRIWINIGHQNFGPGSFFGIIISIQMIHLDICQTIQDIWRVKFFSQNILETSIRFHSFTILVKQIWKNNREWIHRTDFMQW